MRHAGSSTGLTLNNSFPNCRDFLLAVLLDVMISVFIEALRKLNSETAQQRVTGRDRKARKFTRDSTK
jgi:hypothetical protein